MTTAALPAPVERKSGTAESMSAMEERSQVVSDFRFDRCNQAPRHAGPNVFRNFYLWSRMVRWAHKPNLVAVRDLTFGYTATYTQLLTDVLHLRNQLRELLDPSAVAKLDRDADVFVNLLGPGGYEFTVGFLALVALGAVVVPISPDLPPREAQYFATKSRASAVLTADGCLKLGTALEGIIVENGNRSFRSIPIRPHLMRKCLSPSELQVSSDAYMDLNRTAYVIFTSGSFISDTVLLPRKD